MAQSLMNYVKNNPVESALAVASIHPAVRLGRFAFTAGKSIVTGIKKRQKLGNILQTRKSVHLYRGVPDKTLTLKEAKQRVKAKHLDHGKWFTTNKDYAKAYAKKVSPSVGATGKGSIYRIKITPTELRKMKQGNSSYDTQSRKFHRSLLTSKKTDTSIKLTNREFTGVVPDKIRRKAEIFRKI